MAALIDEARQGVIVNTILTKQASHGLAHVV
jgi:hypothetical protein